MDREKNPSVSILLSYHNGSRFLETYLKNVEQQTIFKDTELVAVTSPLTEKERELFLSFKQKYTNNISVIEQTELKPQSYYWNIALKNSRAKYTCIWNIDDIRTSYSLEKQFKNISSTNCIATYGYFIISKQYGNFFGQLIDHFKYQKEEYERSMLLGPFFMFDKTACEKIGYFDEQMKSGADFDFAVRLAKIGIIKMINSIDGYFLDEQNGLSTRGDGLQPLECNVVLLRYGVNDKTSNYYVEKAKELYDIEHIINFDKKIAIKGII